jgi:hypothetical protein
MSVKCAFWRKIMQHFVKHDFTPVIVYLQKIFFNVTHFFTFFQILEHYADNVFFVIYFPKSILGFQNWTFINVQISFSFLLLRFFLTLFIKKGTNNEFTCKTLVS